MNLSSINQIEFKNLLSMDIDLVICSSGFETRSSILAKSLSIYKNRIVIGFKEHKNENSRTKNDKIFSSYKYEYKELSGNSNYEAGNLLNFLLNGINKSTCNILIDISSMTRSWYGEFLKTLSKNNKFSHLNCYFTYVPAANLQSHNHYPPNEIVAPIQGFSGLGLANKPVALVIGLGHHENRALGINEELDPALTSLFIADPSVNEMFPERVRKMNKDILEMANQKFQFKYSIFNPISTFNKLSSFCSGLSKNYHVVLTSLGPKIFGLCCFLTAINEPEISVWRISAGSRTKQEDIKPSNYKLVVESKWVLN